jgi:hypothetical protein
MRLAYIGSLVALMMLPGCVRSREAPTEAQAMDAEIPIDNPLMAYLSMARARHHEANLEEDSDLPAAVAALDRLVAAPCPHPGAAVPEVEEVLADAFARIAELQLRQQNVTAAAESVRQGLLHAPEPTYFRGHLLEVGGLTEEAREAALRDAGASAAAATARQRAIDLFHQAVVVQEHVIRASLADTGTAEGNP